MPAELPFFRIGEPFYMRDAFSWRYPIFLALWQRTYSELEINLNIMICFIIHIPTPYALEGAMNVTVFPDQLCPIKTPILQFPGINSGHYNDAHEF